MLAPLVPVRPRAGGRGFGREGEEGVPGQALAAGGAPEMSTWSTRSEASMNDVDTDQRGPMMAVSRNPNPRHRLECPKEGRHARADVGCR
jgi:hypothetical protein